MCYRVTRRTNTPTSTERQARDPLPCPQVPARRGERPIPAVHHPALQPPAKVHCIPPPGPLLPRTPCASPWGRISCVTPHQRSGVAACGYCMPPHRLLLIDVGAEALVRTCTAGAEAGPASVLGSVGIRPRNPIGTQSPRCPAWRSGAYHSTTDDEDWLLPSTPGASHSLP